MQLIQATLVRLGANRAFPPAGVSACGNQPLAFTDPAVSSCTAIVTCAPVIVGSEIYCTVESVGLCSAGDVEARRPMQVRLKR